MMRRIRGVRSTQNAALTSGRPRSLRITRINRRLRPSYCSIFHWGLETDPITTLRVSSVVLDGCGSLRYTFIRKNTINHHLPTFPRLFFSSSSLPISVRWIDDEVLIIPTNVQWSSHVDCTPMPLSKSHMKDGKGRSLIPILQSSKTRHELPLRIRHSCIASPSNAWKSTRSPQCDSRTVVDRRDPRSQDCFARLINVQGTKAKRSFVLQLLVQSMGTYRKSSIPQRIRHTSLTKKPLLARIELLI